MFLDPSNVITRKGREPGTQGEREGAGLDLVITRAREAWGGGVRDGRWKRETFEKSAEKLKAKEGRKVRTKGEDRRG